MNCVNKAKNKVKSWHLSEYIPKMVRDPLVGNITNIGVIEAVAYKIVNQDIEDGALPGYTMCLVIPLIAAVEAFLGPLVSWLGYKDRRKTILGYSIAVIIIPLAWLLVPAPVKLQETEFCNSTIVNPPIPYETLTMRASLRLMVVLASTVCICLARVATWGHFVAFSDDHAPDRTSIHMGILILTRVLTMVFYNILTQSVGKWKNLLAILFVAFFTSINTVRLYFNLPKTESTDAKDRSRLADRGFFLSLTRVLCNQMAMTQMIGMGLLAGALWGFGHHEEDIVKTNFNILHKMDGMLDTHTHFFRLLIAILAVLYMGVKQSAPVRPKYDILKGLQVIFTTTLVAIFMYGAIVTIPQCKKGLVAGLETELYAHPQCSLSCGCVPRWTEYSPVCALDTMTTYLSPCEAGCTGSTDIDGLQVFTNCSCTPSGRAAPGACSDYNCQLAYDFHVMAFCVILTVTVVALQAQSMIVLRSVDARDKSIAMGVMFSVIAIVAFVCANNLFYYIGVRTCSWLAGGRCQLQSQWFSYAVGFTCAALSVTSLLINIIAKRSLRNKLDTSLEAGPSGG